MIIHVPVITSGKEEGSSTDHGGHGSPGLGGREAERSPSTATTSTVEHSQAVATASHWGGVYQVGTVVTCHGVDGLRCWCNIHSGHCRPLFVMSSRSRLLVTCFLCLELIHSFSLHTLYPSPCCIPSILHPVAYLLSFTLLHTLYPSPCCIPSILHPVTYPLSFTLLHTLYPSPCCIPSILHPVAYLLSFTLLHTLYPSSCYIPSILHPVAYLLSFTLLHTLYPSPCYIPSILHPASYPLSFILLHTLYPSPCCTFWGWLLLCGDCFYKQLLVWISSFHIVNIVVGRAEQTVFDDILWHMI